MTYYVLKSGDGRFVMVDAQSGARLTPAAELAFHFETRTDATSARAALVREIDGLEVHAVFPGSTGP